MSKTRAPASLDLAPTSPEAAVDPATTPMAALQGSYGNAFLAALLGQRPVDSAGDLGRLGLEQLGRTLTGDRSLERGLLDWAGEGLFDQIEAAEGQQKDAQAGWLRALGDASGHADLGDGLAEVGELPTEVLGGVAKGVVNLGEGLGALAVDPIGAAAGMRTLARHTGGLPGALIRAQDEGFDALLGKQGWGEALQRSLDFNQKQAEDDLFWRDLVASAGASLKEDWDAGRQGEVYGRVAVELALLAAPAAIPKLGKVGALGEAGAQGARAADTLSPARVAELSEGLKKVPAATGDWGADASRLQRVEAALEGEGGLRGNKDLARQAARAGLLGETEVFAALDEGAAAMRGLFQDPTISAEALKKGLNLLDDENYLFQATQRMLANNPHLTMEEAVAAAEATHAFLYRGRLYLRNSTPPELLREVLTHEVGHTTVSPALRTGANLQINEALTQWSTEKALGEATVGYPEHVRFAKEMEALLGEKRLMELMRTGTRDDLLAELNQASPGAGDRILSALDGLRL